MRDFIFGTFIEHNNYYPSHDKLPLKCAWSRSRDQILKFRTTLTVTSLTVWTAHYLTIR